ncbi:phage tail protein [Sporosarcina sp. FA9]|uniref:phage tail protein n=1 Tax=Sporosarcina sp. FA9 TaxID=3413030 RepID=UPI003F65E895
MAITLEELQILITSETSDLRRELDRVKQELGKMNSAVKSSTDGMKKAFKAVAVAIAALGIGKHVKNAVMAASELESAFLGLQSIMEGQGRSFGKAKGFINDYISDGLVPLTDAVMAYKNLAARGYNDDQIEQTMERLKDSAAFGRQAGLTLGGAVATATEGLKNENSVLVDNAGVTRNVAKMWEDYATTIGKTAKNLSDQEKIQAEVNGIMNETRFQIGDAAKYADTYAGRLALLSKTLGDIQVNIGQAFMPIANFVIPVLQKLAGWLVKVTAYFKYFMQAFFGVSKSQKQSNVAAGGGAVAQDSFGIAAENAGKKAEKSGKKVKKAAEEAKRSVAGFDEINTLSEPSKDSDSDSSGGSGADGGGIGGMDDLGMLDFEMPEIDTEAIPAQIQAMADKVKGIFSEMGEGAKGIGLIFAGAFSGIGPALQPLYDAIEPIKVAFADIGKTFIQLVEDYLKPMAGYILTDFIPSIVIGFVKDFAPVLANVAVWSIELLAKTFKNTTDMMVSLWNGTWLPSLERIKKAWVDANTSVAKSLQNLLDGTIKPLVDYLLNSFILPIAKRIQEVLVPIFTDILVFAFKETAKTFEWLANLINDIYKTVIEPVFDLLKKIVLDTLQIVQDLWKKHGQTLLDNLSGLFDGIRDLFQLLWDKILDPIITPFLEMFTWLWDKHLKGLVEEVGTFIMKLVNGALEILNKFILPIVNYLIEKLSPTFTRVFQFIADVVGSAVGMIAGYIQGTLKVMGGLIDYIVGVFTGNWTKAWEGIRDVFKGIVEMISSIFKGVLNITIDIINFAVKSVLDGINTMIQGAIKLINAIPGVDIQISPISVPRIPKLARGGIVDGATNFGNYIAGEAGKEMVIPLENTPFVDKLASALGTAVMAAMQMGGANQQTSGDGGDVILNLDGTTLARVLNPYLGQENQRIGSAIIQPI